jgi:ATP-binding cassette subfamily C protein LapB
MPSATKNDVMSVYYNAGRYDISGIVLPFSGAIRRIFMLSFLINVLSVMIPVFIMFFADRRVSFSLASGGALNVVLLSSILGFNFIFRYVRAGMISYILFSIDAEVCNNILEKVFKIPAKKMEKKTEAFWHSVFADIDVIRNGLSGSYVVNLFDVPFVLLFVGTIGILFDRYFFVVLLFLLAYAAFVVFAVYMLGVVDDKEKMAVKERDELVSGTIHNLSSFKTLALTDRVRDMWMDYQESIIDNTYRRNYTLDICIVLSFVIYFLGLVVLSIVGMYALDTGLMSAGALLAALLLFSYAFILIDSFIKYLPEYFKFINSTERLSQVMAEQVDAIKTESIDSVTTGNLVLKNVVLDDGRRSAILSGVDFTFKDGTVYVVRAKSTFDSSIFLKSLLGAYDLESGQVMFDRYDVAQLAADSVKDYMHYSGEGYFAIEGTIKENLNCLISKDEKDSAYAGFVDYRKAAEMLGFDEAVARLPNGYNTTIDAKTDLLSQEELKLMSIARVFVGNPRVMLFDQPFLGLRKNYREKLIAALAAMSADRIVIVSTLDKDIAKKTVVSIEDGKMTTLNSDTFDEASKEIAGRTPEDEGGNRALFRKIFRKKK